jgi:hypothetical protein
VIARPGLLALSAGVALQPFAPGIVGLEVFLEAFLSLEAFEKRSLASASSRSDVMASLLTATASAFGRDDGGVRYSRGNQELPKPCRDPAGHRREN